MVPFEQLFKPGPKNYDFDMNEVSVTNARKKSVDFSDSYYNTNQALVAMKGTPITKAKTMADLKKYKLGAQTGTTSYNDIVKNIQPASSPPSTRTRTSSSRRFKSGQVDGIVVDLPTAFYIDGAGRSRTAPSSASSRPRAEARSSGWSSRRTTAWCVCEQGAGDAQVQRDARSDGDEVDPDRGRPRPAVTLSG